MIKQLYWILTLAQVICASFPALAKNYGYHPKSILHIGGGFDPNDPSAPFRPCLVTFQSIPDDKPAHGTKFTEKVVSDTKDVYEFLHLDATLSARYSFISATASFSLDDTSALHSDSLTWIVKAETDFGMESVPDGVDLNDAAKALKNNPTRFYNRCGKEVVLKQQRFAELAMVFTLHNISSERKRELQTHLTANANDPVSGNGGSLSTNYTNVLKEATKSGEVNVEVYAIGGDGISRLAPLVLKGEDFDSVRKTAADYLAGLTRENAGVIGYSATSWKVFGVGDEISFSEDPRLAELFYFYTDGSDRVQRLGNIVRNADSAFEYLTQSDLDSYQSQYNAWADYVEKVRQAGLSCATQHVQNACAFKAAPPTPIRWPVEPTIGCSRWVRGQCYACELPVVLQGAMPGKKITLQCEKMPNLPVTATFTGFVVINPGVQDNKVWNGWTELTLAPKGGQCPPQENCSAEARFSPTWNLLQIKKIPGTVSGGISAWDIVLAHCATGPNPNAACDTVPPGTEVVKGTIPASPLPAQLKVEVVDPNALKLLVF